MKHLQVGSAEEGLEGTLAVLKVLGGEAEHADHGNAAVLELSGLKLEEGLGVGVGEACRRKREKETSGSEGGRDGGGAHARVDTFQRLGGC